jgi:hypothetical protein
MMHAASFKFKQSLQQRGGPSIIHRRAAHTVMRPCHWTKQQQLWTGKLASCAPPLSRVTPRHHHPKTATTRPPAGDTAANLAGQLTSSQAGAPSLLGNGAGNSAAVAAANVLQDSRFVRAAKTVGECLGRVKTLSERVNSATGFRESCSKLLGAAFAASLALQEVRVCDMCFS